MRKIQRIRSLPQPLLEKKNGFSGQSTNSFSCAGIHFLEISGWSRTAWGSMKYGCECLCTCPDAHDGAERYRGLFPFARTHSLPTTQVSSFSSKAGKAIPVHHVDLITPPRRCGGIFFLHTPSIVGDNFVLRHDEKSCILLRNKLILLILQAERNA